MEFKLHGYISCVCVAENPLDLQSISNFVQFFSEFQNDFEMIVCINSKNEMSKRIIDDFCASNSNLAIYEIATTSFDSLITAGIELALGDWVLELPNIRNLEADSKELFEKYFSADEDEADSYQLLPLRQPLLDRLLSKLASSALEVPVYTLAYVPRLTRRTALQAWNIRKLRSKVLRVAPQLNRSRVHSFISQSGFIQDYSRISRVGLRTIVHSSAKPLRWVSFTSLIGALVSVIISSSVVIIGISRKAIPGWTTTNLLISSVSFLILLVLGILTEYIYQIAAASLDQPSFQLIRESLSPIYSFRIKPNVVHKIENEL